MAEACLRCDGTRYVLAVDGRPLCVSWGGGMARVLELQRRGALDRALDEMPSSGRFRLKAMLLLARGREPFTCMRCPDCIYTIIQDGEGVRDERAE